MRRLIWFLFALSAVLNGCASQPSIWDSMDGLIQQHVSVAIRWLGEPTAQLTLAGDLRTAFISPFWAPTSRHTMAGDFPKFGKGTFYAWSSTGDRSGCLINLYTDPNGIVTGAAKSGDSRQCAHYAEVLNHAPRRPQRYCGAYQVAPCIE
jgi:hypothetical protein